MQTLLQLNLNCNFEGKLKIIQNNLQINLKIIGSIVKHVSIFFFFLSFFYIKRLVLKRSILLIGKSSGLITRVKELIIDYFESLVELSLKERICHELKKKLNGDIFYASGVRKIDIISFLLRS